jgi:hypothetical protein
MDCSISCLYLQVSGFPPGKYLWGTKKKQKQKSMAKWEYDKMGWEILWQNGKWE